MVKLKVRDGCIFSIEKVFKNDNMISLRMDYLNWGVGVNLSVGDSRLFFQVYFLCLHLDVWI